MKVNLIEKKLKLDGETREYAEKKVGKLDRFFKTDSEATVTFSPSSANRQRLPNNPAS